MFEPGKSPPGGEFDPAERAGGNSLIIQKIKSLTIQISNDTMNLRKNKKYKKRGGRKMKVSGIVMYILLGIAAIASIGYTVVDIMAKIKIINL